MIPLLRVQCSHQRCSRFGEERERSDLSYCWQRYAGLHIRVSEGIVDSDETSKINLWYSHVINDGFVRRALAFSTGLLLALTD